MDSIERRKKEIREQFNDIRMRLGKDLVTQLSLRILDHLSAHEFYENSETVHCFMSIEKNREVDTAPIIKKMLSDGKKVIVPKSKPDTTILEHYLYKPDGRFEMNRLGIMEPVDGVKVGKEELDLVLVPMLAADHQKNRLGYGLGYYDRFLANIDAVKAGLIFEACISEEPLPVDEFDIRMDYLITEKGVY